MNMSDVRVIVPTLGGGYGGKIDPMLRAAGGAPGAQDPPSRSALR